MLDAGMLKVFLGLLQKAFARLLRQRMLTHSAAWTFDILSSEFDSPSALSDSLNRAGRGR